MSKLCAAAVFTTTLAFGQTSATLSGRVSDPRGLGVDRAAVTLENPLNGARLETQTGPGGDFRVANIPFHDYVLQIRKSGFAVATDRVRLRTNIEQRVEIELALAGVEGSVSVSAFDSADLVDPQETGTRAALSSTAIERSPVPIGTRGLEAVLASFPGFAVNANGAIHPRGAHNQMTYVIDGLPISDQLTGSFASSLDPSIVQTIELFTGNVPAAYGNKVSGVAQITTRSGLGAGRRFAGMTETQAAGFGTGGNTTQVSGEAGRLGYFATVSALKSNRFLDAVSLDNLHNGGNAERGYLKLDWQASPRDVLRFHAMAGRSSFQLANLRSQHAAAQDQRQLLRDSAFWLGWLRTLGPNATFDTTAAWRTSIGQLFSSPGDTPVTADQSRHLSTGTVNANLNVIAAAHTWRGGVSWQHIPISEDFSFAITQPGFNDPLTRPALAAHDLSRGGRRFVFSGKASGNLYSAHLQDNIRLGNWALALGMRYDAYRFLVNGYQWQPRLGIAYHLQPTRTVLRASYNRNFQTPPNENLLLSASPQAAALAPVRVRETLGAAVLGIQPERQDVFELGLQQALLGKASLNLAYYYKRSRDQQDNDNFLNTGVIFPLTLNRIRVNGAEARVNLPEWAGLSGSLSLTHYRAISTPPFTGGLFLNEGAVDVLTAGPFVIDHDQTLGAQANLFYTPARRPFWFSSTLRYDSGLVSNPSDPAVVARDPDYADLLPYVRLNLSPSRVAPRAIHDFAVGYVRNSPEGRRAWEIQGQVTNLWNRTAVYNFQSIFVGTRLVQPRTLGVKMRLFF
ncbi:MAG: TonB-dependent receptor [Bryobacteraceae bacterium]